MLDIKKLNVQNKYRANLFNWRGQFTPQLIEYLLNIFASSNDVIVDPFVGSGTVLQEAARLNLEAYGIEINPAAYAMSKFFTFSNVPREKRKYFIEKSAQIINDTIYKYKSLPIYEDNSKDGFRKAYYNFNKFAASVISKCDSKEIRIIMLNILFKAEAYKKFTIYEAMSRSFSQIKKSLLSLKYCDSKIDAFLCDARNINKKVPHKANLIITSPPYINVFNYHQNYRSIMELLGFNLLRVAESEFGSNRKNRGNRYKTVVQYCMDIEEALYSILKALDNLGKVLMIIGRQSNVRRVPFYNGSIVHKIIETIEGFRIIKNEERAFNNKFGNKIIEDILIFQKIKESKCHFKARDIAKENLLKALEYANSDVKNDIQDAINTINTIQPSPILNVKDIITNGQTTTPR